MAIVLILFESILKRSDYPSPRKDRMLLTMICKRTASRCRLGPRPQTVAAIGAIAVSIAVSGCAASAPRADQRAALLVEHGQNDEAVRVLRERLSKQPRDV